ncbi:branched-chain amino acid ABC transporter substrate-binding protein [Desulfobotulus mexicanus]|uniref:Branched-chain amino acid ABC transporter substrate-binding protein n=1 Tax=Desulfobotulus mexicanus TaxID=2586642 RepID=A0A5Q4VEX9_9BACT|nr:branched-chain amino acid ABC transporter substrate-binding protein [Desulfobotulus mexicanus]TYT76224.1 branched-chain amino acid ABC transporter substrate-binding protein [Desulfobotulus mexicanus]
MKKVLCLAAALCFMAAPAFAETIRIGLMAPMTGSWASEGQDMRDIVTLMAEELNAKGGVLDKKVEIVVEDDAGDPRAAALAAQRLSTRKVAAVIGTYGSSVAEAAQNIYDDYDIIQVANGATSNRLTEKGLNFFFRTCPRNDEQAMVAAKALQSMGFSKIAILHDNTSYARGLADDARKFIGEVSDAKVVFFNALTPGERDFNTVLTRMRASDPDVILFTGYYPEAGLLLRQKMEMGWDVPMMGGDATNNPDLVEIAGTQAASGFYFLSPPVPQDLPTDEARAFLAAFEKKYSKLPGSIWAVLAGDAFTAIVTAIEGAGSTDSKKVAEYMRTRLKDMPALTGTISFNSVGDRIGDVYRVYQVNAEGAFVLMNP